MGKTRRKFTIGFKQQVIQEIEGGLITTAQAARKYEVSQGASIAGDGSGETGSWSRSPPVKRWPSKPRMSA